MFRRGSTPWNTRTEPLFAWTAGLSSFFLQENNFSLQPRISATSPNGAKSARPKEIRLLTLLERESRRRPPVRSAGRSQRSPLSQPREDPSIVVSVSFSNAKSRQRLPRESRPNPSPNNSGPLRAVVVFQQLEAQCRSSSQKSTLETGLNGRNDCGTDDVFWLASSR